MIKQLLTMEGKAPFTMHEPRLAEYRQECLDGYQAARVPLRHQGDAFAHALFYMATARGYFLGLCLSHHLLILLGR